MVPQQLISGEIQIEEDIQWDEEAEEIEVDISHLVLEDDTPVDNFQSAQQQRLLVEPLYSTSLLPLPFIAEANVGIFYKSNGDPIVPDVLLSLGVQRAADYSNRRNRSYFTWKFGKVPDVCIEIVSNTEGDELTLSRKSEQKGKTATKKEIYAFIGVPYYVVFDPLRQIQGDAEMRNALLRVWILTAGQYVELTPEPGLVNAGQSIGLDTIGIGLALWDGQFEEDVSRLWLRWCDRDGQVIQTGAERAETERQRAETERQRAEAERQRAEAERQRAEDAEAKAQRLAEQLRALGINPDDG